jgi:hypothetical protein
MSLLQHFFLVLLANYSSVCCSSKKIKMFKLTNNNTLAKLKLKLFILQHKQQKQ